MKILHDRILIKLDGSEEAPTDPNTGIILATTKESEPRGLVTQISEDLDKDIRIKVGDEVLYEVGAGSKIELDGDKFRVVKEEHILAIL